ncbi:MAG: hypothetical protein MK316_11380 [Pseudomonadales bacterium]|nr:hypothetical protein [Pseudomonadales bacterium]
MPKLLFSRDELMTDHDFASEHVVQGQVLHGGFNSAGDYLPPRSEIRGVAIANWTDALRARGGDLLDADASLLSGPRVPNPEQQRLLIREGLGRTFWNGLTITGKIEGRGRMIAEIPFPDMQELVVEDIGEMAIGHLKKGLLEAHGIDEGGQPEKGIGGHDVMWFVARDLVFGPEAFPDLEPPGGISRAEAGRRWMPQIPQPYELALSFLMNLLVIEFRAEIGFANTQETLRTDDLFIDKRSEAELAAEIVERIRTDERIHVESLRLYIGELRSVHFKTEDGGTVLGSDVLDPFWEQLIGWATGQQPRIAAEQQYNVIKERILEHEEGERVLAQFDALADSDFLVAAG